MRHHRTAALLCAAVALQFLGTVPSSAADYNGPYRDRHYGGRRASVGDCVQTRVETIGVPPGGSTPVMRFSDGVVEEYDAGMLGQQETRPGDPIQLCLVAFTRDCGLVFADDQPGRTYATGNLRTGAAWTQPDLRSRCVAR